MFPTLFRIGSFEVTSFGLMMFLAFITAGWVLTKQFKRYGLSEDLASSIVMAAAIGGIVGAKIYYAILFHDWHLLFDRAGLVWYGGLIGGVIACSWLIWRKGVDYFTVADATAPALAIGYSIGRIGCFLVGDDYGRPTNSWVGIAFPKGSPPTTAESLRQFGVHVDPSIPPDQVLRVYPTQTFETVTAFIVFLILLRLSRREHAKGRVFGWFLVLMGIERILVEIVRAKDDRFLGPFTIAQLISAIAVILGVVLLIYAERSEASRVAPRST